MAIEVKKYTNAFFEFLRDLIDNDTMIIIGLLIGLNIVSDLNLKSMIVGGLLSKLTNMKKEN